MKNVFKKMVSIAVLIVMIFSLSLNILPQRAQAMTPGQAAGKALGAAASCFIQEQIESYAKGLAAKALAQPEKVADIGINFAFVPVFNMGNAEVSKREETTAALNRCKDVMRDVIVKTIMDWMADETVKWIQGGGEPGFVTDWGNFADDFFNVGVGEVINNSSLRFLCSPFSTQVRFTLLPVQRFEQQISCTLDQITGNVESFINNFNNGGWLAYNQSWMPQNNYYGATMMIQDEAIRRGLAKQESAVNEALSGKGFLSAKRCIEGDPEETAACNDPSTTPPEQRAACLASVSCAKYEITTPGDIVGLVVGNAVSTDQEYVKNVKSWTAAIVNALINRLFTEGLAALSSSDDPAPPGGNFDPWATTDPIQKEKRQAIESMVNDYEDINFDLNATIQRIDATLAALRDLKATLEAMRTKNCNPPVTDADIILVQAKIDLLTKNAVDYGAIVLELNQNISEAEAILAKSTISDSEAELIMQKNTDFMQKNITLATDIFSGNLLRRADEDLNDAKKKLADAQVKLSACSVTIF